MFQFMAETSVVEVRESLQRLVLRGILSEKNMISMVKKYAEEKTKIQEGQKYIVIIEN